MTTQITNINYSTPVDDGQALADIMAGEPLMTSVVPTSGAYFRISKAALESLHALGMTGDTLVLYSVLHARMELSSINNFADDDGVYCLFSAATAYDLFGWGRDKYFSELAALETAGLLLRMDNHLYLRELIVNSENLRRYSRGDAGVYPAVDKYINSARYVQLPAMWLDLVNRGLTLRAVLLYAILRDRIDEAERFEHRDGDILFCSIREDDACRYLGCSPRSLKRTYAELEAANLILRRPGGGHRLWHVYCRDCSIVFAGSQNPQPEVPKSAPSSGLEVPKTDTIYPLSRYNNYPSRSQPHSREAEVRAKSAIFDSVDFETVDWLIDTDAAPQRQSALHDLAERAYEIMMEDAEEQRFRYRVINGTPYPVEALIDAYSANNPLTFYLALSAVDVRMDSVHNANTYLRAALRTAADKFRDQSYVLRHRYQLWA